MKFILCLCAAIAAAVLSISGFALTRSFCPAPVVTGELATASEIDIVQEFWRRGKAEPETKRVMIWIGNRTYTCRLHFLSDADRGCEVAADPKPRQVVGGDK